MLIFKFGGASVGDAKGVRNLGKIVLSHSKNPLVVIVSAMGKSTNLLEELARLAFDGRSFKNELNAFKSFHIKIAEELFGEVHTTFTSWIIRLEESLTGNKKGSFSEFNDSIVCYGELLSTAIVEMYLSTKTNTAWLDARQVVRTNSIFGEANVDWQLTSHFIKKDLQPLLEEKVVVTQGYIGSDFTGKTTTLGREGSDYSGAVFAHSLDAKNLTVWKDVPGLLNADPKVFDFAEKFDQLSYQEVTELTYYGAKVIHPKTIRPLAQKKIPLLVKSFQDPNGSGTQISEFDITSNKPCFVLKTNQTLGSLRVKDHSLMDERRLGVIFQALDHCNIKVNMMHNSALTFSFCMDHHDMKLEKLKNYLVHDFSLLYNENLTLATIKHYDEVSLARLPHMKECILEQKTRNNYQVAFR